MKESKKVKIIEMPRCPKCGSKNTVGMVDCCSIDKTTNTKKGFFCSKCLIEFDKDIIRCYSSNGSWVANLAIDSLEGI